MEQSIIQAITVEDNITKISIMEVPDKPGIAFGLFRKLSENDIKIEENKKYGIELLKKSAEQGYEEAIKKLKEISNI